MYMKSLIPVTAALLLLAACGQRNASRQTAPAAAQTAVPDMHDAENALDYRRLSGRRCTGHRRHADARLRRTLHRGEPLLRTPRPIHRLRTLHRPREHTHPAPQFAERHSRLLPGRRKPALAARQPPTAHYGTVRRPVHPHQIGFGNSRRLLLTPLPTRSIPPVRESPPSAHGRSWHRGRRPDRGGEIKKPPARVSCGRSIETAPKRR